MNRLIFWSVLVVLGVGGSLACSASPKKTIETSPVATKTTPETGVTPPVASKTEPSKAPPMIDPKTGKVDPKSLAPKGPARKLYEIAPTGTQKWTASKLSGKELASKIGSAMRSLRATYGKTISTIKTPTGTGQVTSEIKIQDDKVYSIQYIVVGIMPETGEVRADGKRRAFTGPNGAFKDRLPITVPSPEAKLSVSQISSSWPKKFPRLAFLGLTDAKDPWVPVISDLVSGKSGFKTEVSERISDFRGKKLRNYRIVAKRSPAAAKTLGPCEIEMVFDGVRYLPVTMRVNTKFPKEGEFKIQWQSGWNFDQKFKPEDFKI